MSGLKFIVIICAALLLSAGMSQSQDTAGRGLASGPLKLTIRPAKPAYDLQDATVGNVVIHAEVHNTGRQSVLLGHPNVCVPHELSAGESFTPDPSQSHLSVRVEHPDGTTKVLWNNGLRMFDPGNRHHMTIMPGQTRQFILGWFGPEYSLGQWKIDRALFTETGRYRITVRYKNAYPVAYVFDEAGKQSATAATSHQASCRPTGVPRRRPYAPPEAPVHAR